MTDARRPAQHISAWVSQTRPVEHGPVLVEHGPVLVEHVRCQTNWAKCQLNAVHRLSPRNTFSSLTEIVAVTTLISILTMQGIFGVVWSRDVLIKTTREFIRAVLPDAYFVYQL